MTPISHTTTYKLTLADITVRIANELNVPSSRVSLVPNYKSSEYDGPSVHVPSRNIVSFDVIVKGE